MDEAQVVSPRVPGAVLFVSILNFLSASVGFLVALLGILLMVLGASARFYEQMTTDLARATPPINLTFGVTFFFLVAISIALFFGILFLSIGIGLLKRKRFAWYIQVAMSVVGLLGFPIGTLINGVILAFFFQAPVRNHFKI